MVQFKFNLEKAVAATLYIASSLVHEKVRPDFHKVFKILYFADQSHLITYGFPITGDVYIAMSHGPVPSTIYDIFKTAKGECYLNTAKRWNDFFEIKGSHFIYPKIAPDIEVLSPAEIECLDVSINDNKNLSFSELKEKSHGSAYKKATKDDKISMLEIAKEKYPDPAMISYIKSVTENENLYNV